MEPDPSPTSSLAIVRHDDPLLHCTLAFATPASGSSAIQVIDSGPESVGENLALAMIGAVTLTLTTRRRSARRRPPNGPPLRTTTRIR